LSETLINTGSNDKPALLFNILPVATTTITTKKKKSKRTLRSEESPANSSSSIVNNTTEQIKTDSNCSQKVSHETTPEAIPVKFNIGQALLKQLQALKSRHLTENPNIESPEVPEKYDEDDTTTTHKLYIPEETVIPVSAAGEIFQAIQPNTSTALRGSSSKKSVEVAGPNQQSHQTKSRLVSRPEEVHLSRMDLPICSMEQEIVEAIGANDVVILCGETGSGKSTQVPQFLYEAGYSVGGKQLIGITQPRRVAVTSTALRVAYEMGCSIPSAADGAAATVGGMVGYQVRFESSNLTTDTHIKYMTDGIMLREISNQLLLPQYSVIILDEAHERNINTDVLLGMLCRAMSVRRTRFEEETKRWMSLSEEEKLLFEPPLQPLKLIIMSATLRVNDFQSPLLFSSPPPIIQVEARQYPVVTHFAKRTELRNY